MRLLNKSSRRPGKKYDRLGKNVLLAIAIVASVVVGYAAYLQLREPSARPELHAPTERQAEKNVDTAPPVQQKKLTRIIAAGDFIAHDALNAAAKNAGGYNYDNFTEPMRQVLQKADIRFCNQATLVGGEAFGISGYPLFNAPSSFIDTMQHVGCNVVNTASNHSSDKTQAAIDANTGLWGKKTDMLAVAGQNSSTAQQEEILYFERDGLKYAFLAYTAYSNIPPPSTYAVNMYSRSMASRKIAEAKAAGAKFVIVSMRWGTEYSQTANGFQRTEAQYLADQGVALILGHGPHVLQPVEKLTGTQGNDTVVWYSLGNFLHAQLEPETIFNGVAVLDVDPQSGALVRVAFLPTYMHYDWTAEQAARQDLLARKNFLLMPLDQAVPYFEKSQLRKQTSIELQQQRLKATVATYIAVPFIETKDL